MLPFKYKTSNKKTVERSYQSIHILRKNIFVKLGILVCLGGLHVVIIGFTEKIDYWDAIWLTVTTLTTVGYGDYSAASVMGRLATMLLLYGAGIALLAQIIGEYIDYRAMRREYMAKGRWRWKMKNHIVVVNTPKEGGDFYLQRLIEQIRQTPALSDKSIQLLTAQYPEGLPRPLRELGIVHYHESAFTRHSLEAVHAAEADYVIILAHNSFEFSSDSATFDILGQLRDLKVKGRVIAECVLDENRVRFTNFRANSVIRPIRAYPELLVRAMVAPGTERLLENLFTHQGDHATRYEINIDNVKWHQLASEIIKRDIGTPMGYIRSDGQLICNPQSENVMHASALIIMVSQDRLPSHQDVQACVAQLTHRQDVNTTSLFE